MTRRVLIDTQALIWFAEDGPALSATAVTTVDDPATVRLASAASLWEMAIKVALGKLAIKAGTVRQFATILRANDVDVLPITADDALAVADLPAVDLAAVPGHKDPFDRLIAAQCLRHGLTPVSVDDAIDAYGVRRAW